MALTLSSPALLERLGAEMDVRAPDYALWQDYYDGVNRRQYGLAGLLACAACGRHLIGHVGRYRHRRL